MSKNDILSTSQCHIIQHTPSSDLTVNSNKNQVSQKMYTKYLTWKSKTRHEKIL